jgi:hypothetical protein
MYLQKVALKDDITTTCISRNIIKNLWKKCRIWKSLHINEEISFFLIIQLKKFNVQQFYNVFCYYFTSNHNKAIHYLFYYVSFWIEMLIGYNEHITKILWRIKFPYIYTIQYLCMC